MHQDIEQVECKELNRILEHFPQILKLYKLGILQQFGNCAQYFVQVTSPPSSINISSFSHHPYFLLKSRFMGEGGRPPLENLGECVPL